MIGRFVDICDDLAGIYPKDFKFVGWHPHCRCYCVPKQASKEEFMEYQQRLLNGEDVSNYHFKGEVKDLPRNFKDWYTDNTDRIARAKSQPYFLRDNQKLIEKKSPKYVGTKLGRKAQKEAYEAYKDSKPPTLSEAQKKNITEIANELGIEVTPMNFDEANHGRANINWRNGEEYKNNCQCCVVIHEARLRGLNVTALGYSSDKTSIQYKLGEKFQNIWINPKTGKTPTPTKIIKDTDEKMLAELKKQMSANGRYHIGINQKNGTGHLITVEKTEGGKFLYYDPQDGKHINITSYEDIEYIELLKVDKLLFKKDWLIKISEII